MRRIIILLSLLIITYTISISANSIYYDSVKTNTIKDTLTKQKSDSIAITKEQKTITKQDTEIISTPIKKDSDKAETVLSKTNKYDLIIKRNGESVRCKILRKDIYEVNYLVPNEAFEYRLSTVNIKEIYYADGKYDLIDNTPEKKKKDWTVVTPERDWRNIFVTYDPNEVAGLVEKGPIDGFFEAKRLNSENDLLERNVYSILKKKASTMKAIAVLIVDKKINRMYGEPPNITVKAIAYGKE